MSILGELQALNSGAWVELFVLDCTNIGGEITRFHAGTNEFRNPVVWQGLTYYPYPVEVNGFELNGSGSPPRPKMKVANIDGLLSELLFQMNDLIGAKLIRKRTKVHYLDAENFIDGNENANPNEHAPDEIYYIAQKLTENNTLVEFELSTALDLQDAILPRRQVLATACAWRYREEVCGYTGVPVADEMDRPASNLKQDRCSKTITGCKLRFGSNGVLPFGGFPGVAIVSRM